MLWARLVKLEAAEVSACARRVRETRTVVDLPPELGAHDGGEDLGQDAHPRLLVDDVQLLKPLAHGSRQNVVRLQKPAPARSVLLSGRPVVPVSSEEDDFVLISLQQVVLFGQPGEHVRQEQVEVGLVGVGHGSRIEDEDRASLLRRNRRAIQNRRCSFRHIGRIVGTLARWGHGRERRAPQPVGHFGTHAAHGDGVWGLRWAQWVELVFMR
jgi:hypothetical protein